MNINKFAAFISYLTATTTRHFDTIECETVASYVSQLNEPSPANADEVNAMLHALKEGRFIEAIKAYRTLTGAGLKESKDAIEKYRATS